MKRKGWHRKKRRLRHDHKTQFKNTVRNHYRREAERLYYRGELPGPIEITMSREELLEMYPPVKP